jgi:uncharacterized membrane protein YgcG
MVIDYVSVHHSRTLERSHGRSSSSLCGRSPPRWAGRRSRSERCRQEVIIERIIERAVSAWNFLILSKTNYYDWVAIMHVMLQARGLWDAVNAGTTDYTEDCMALEVISKAVPPEMMGTIVCKPSVKAVWDAITLRNVGVDRVRKAKATTLKREFNSLMFHDGESVDDFGALIGRITNQLVVLGFEYREEEVVRKFLQALPPKFEQIIASIETLLDLETITVDELIGRLKPSEERINRNSGNSITSLNLTGDELVSRLSSRLKIPSSGGSGSKESSSGSGKHGKGRSLSSHGGSSGAGNAGGRGGGGSGGKVTGVGTAAKRGTGPSVQEEEEG